MSRSLVFAALTLLPASALAQATVTENIPANVRSDLARTHFRTGMRYFDLNRFAEAATEFERVFEFTAQTELLYNIARAHEGAGNLQRAVEVYDQFLQREPSAPNAEAIRAHAGELRTRIQAQQPAQTPVNAEPPVLRCSDGSTPSAHGEPSTEPVQSAPTVQTTAPRPALPPPPPLLQLRTRVAFERSALNEVGPWIIASTGLILGGFGAWQAVVASQQSAVVDRANSGDAMGWTIGVQDAYDRVPTSTALAWSLSAVGAGALVSGVVWLAARGPGVRRELVVAAIPQANGATLSVGGAL